MSRSQLRLSKWAERYEREQREAIPAKRDRWERERVAWQRVEERGHWARYQRGRGKALGELERRSKREWSALYGRQERQREQLGKDCRGVLGRFRAELEGRHRWERTVLGKAHSKAVRGIEREAGEAYRSGMEGSEERAREAARTDGRSTIYDPSFDRSARGSVWEERMELVRELDGEEAYEKMCRAVERASQRLTPSQVSSHKGPERSGPKRGGPERDFGPSR